MINGWTNPINSRRQLMGADNVSLCYLDHWTTTLDHPQNPWSEAVSIEVVQDLGPNHLKPLVRGMDHWTPLRGGGPWSTRPLHGGECHRQEVVV